LIALLLSAFRVAAEEQGYSDALELMRAALVALKINARIIAQTEDGLRGQIRMQVEIDGYPI